MTDDRTIEDIDNEIDSILKADYDLYGPDNYDPFTSLIPMIDAILVTAVKLKQVDTMVTAMAELYGKCQNCFDTSAPIRAVDVNAIRGIIFAKMFEVKAAT